MARRKLRGMYISKRALRKHFDPCEFLPETYLLCKLQWGNSGRFWIHWVKNDIFQNRHAEEYFLEEIFELRSSNFCDITWYLSWSPCASCCYKILDFLEGHPNVNIDIRVARVYYADSEESHRGLRDLASVEGVTIKAMSIKDYIDCWDTFIQKGVDYRFSPKNFQPGIARTRSKLSRILEGHQL